MGKLTSEPGYYDVVINNVTLTESKSGTPGIMIGVSLRNDPNDSGDVTLYLTEKTRNNTLETLGQLGWDAPSYDYDLTALEEENPLRGKLAEVSVDTEFYNGKTSTKIKYINAPGCRPKPKPLDRDAKARLTANLRAAMKPVQAKFDAANPDEVPF